MGDTVAPLEAGSTGSARLLGNFPPNRVEMSGNIDITLTAELAEVVREIELRGGPVEVRAAGVTFMDSAALAMIARLAYQHPVRVIDPPKVVEFLLDTTRVIEMVQVVYSLNRPSVNA